VLDPHLSRDFLGGFFLRYESLKTDYESGRISRERINSIIEGNFNDPAKTQNQDSVAQRLSYSERQIEKILLLSITLAAVQYLRDDDLELVPFSI
jgi:hypothetical protein